jgi:putative DNA primase/helicase
VVASETDDNSWLAESKIKRLTGGDPITARRMREDFWTFNPSHKLILTTNHKPKVKGTDHGIWRRLLLVPFTQTFDGARRDKGLAGKLRDEEEGILAWAVQGCLDWLKFGLQPPPEVQDATKDYRSDQDVVGRFVSACCIRDRALKVKFSNLYEALESWCKESGDATPGRKVVGEWLRNQEFQEKQSNGRFYLGLALKPEAE